jgi:hypothetical protein
VFASKGWQGGSIQVCTNWKGTYISSVHAHMNRAARRDRRGKILLLLLHRVPLSYYMQVLHGCTARAVRHGECDDRELLFFFWLGRIGIQYTLPSDYITTCTLFCFFNMTIYLPSTLTLPRLEISAVHPRETSFLPLLRWHFFSPHRLMRQRPSPPPPGSGHRVGAPVECA